MKEMSEEQIQEHIKLVYRHVERDRAVLRLIDELDAAGYNIDSSAELDKAGKPALMLTISER